MSGVVQQPVDTAMQSINVNITINFSADVAAMTSALIKAANAVWLRRLSPLFMNAGP